MFYSWLDRWDERRAQRGEAGKKDTDVILDAGRAFPGAQGDASIEQLGALADQAVVDPSFFNRPADSDFGLHRRGEWLEFPSDILTDIPENNLVWAKVTEGGASKRALMIFHHWNARSWNDQIASFFARRGITVVELAMPYHFQRSRPGSLYADYMLSPNLARTVQAVRQAVLDGRKLLDWLRSEGYRDISVLGISLGSWVAGLVAAHDPAVSKASLFLTAGSLADMVWTGRATRSIRNSLEPEIDLSGLRRAWRPLNLENYAHRLARPDLKMQIVLAKRDKVVLPEISEEFLLCLKKAGVESSLLRLNCGHYSLSLPPYILRAGLCVDRFLKTSVSGD